MPELPSSASLVDMIVAISTPPGRGGIGIVRLSGPGSLLLAPRLVHLSHPLEHARARFGHVLDPCDVSVVLDEALVTAFHAPHSYTGEDLVEIATHGSPVVLASLLEAAFAAGRTLGVDTRLARPGEFTERAFLAGRLDLTQAEAVHDLIAAHTLEQVRTAAQQLGGALSRRVGPAKEALLHLIALLEAGMDFASGELDDVDVVAPAQIRAAIASASGPLSDLAASYQRGRIEREGATVALVGRPNAGKSSLFNRLLERDRSIVTASPGTTRDTVDEGFSLEGIPLRLVDTAGLRNAAAASEPLQEAEVEGMLRSREALAEADIVLLVHDATEPWSQDEASLKQSLEGRPYVRVDNKIDLLMPHSTAESSVAVSARTGQGIELLRRAMLGLLTSGAAAEAGSINTLRQQQTVLAALQALAAAETANDNALPHEVLLMDLHTARRELDALTGETTTEDILGRIFSTFCIGK